MTTKKRTKLFNYYYIFTFFFCNGLTDDNYGPPSFFARNNHGSRFSFSFFHTNFFFFISERFSNSRLCYVLSNRFSHILVFTST